jgi:hypothetical protein
MGAEEDICDQEGIGNREMEKNAVRSFSIITPHHYPSYKARRSWAVHVARIGERRYSYRVLGGGNQRQTHAKDLDADSMIILKWNSRTEDGRRRQD